MVNDDIKVYIKNPCTFLEYRKGNLWYTATLINGERFDFPVPIDDIGDGIFHITEKGILMMRYIRKHIQSINEGSLA